MGKIKRLFFTIENFLSGKPITTAIIFAIVAPLIPATISSINIDSMLSKEYQFTGYVIYGTVVILLFTIAISFRFFRERGSKKSIVKKINAILYKIDNPFERQSETMLGKQIISEKFFDYEMMKSFKEYNDILADVKRKWNKEFLDLEPLINNKLVHPGDWIPESELNGVKISLLQLKQRIDQ